MTKPRVTRARGNGGIRENKIDRLAMNHPPATPARQPHISYSTGRCNFQYNDGQRCTWDGELLDAMCQEHRSEVMTAARVKRWQEGRSRPTPPAPGTRDDSAPWSDGGRDGKPTYAEWAKEVMARGQESEG